MKANMEKKQNFRNIFMNIFAFGMQFLISFYISPIIVDKVGSSAYGFVGLANDFVSYISIIATVFNSVASRFIANAFYKRDFETANRYYNSLIVANSVIAGIIGFIGLVLIPSINRFLSIPDSLVLDVKITFALVFCAYIISLLTTVFTTATFVSNRTDIQGTRNIIQSLVRFAVIIVFFNFVSIHIYWIALASLIAGVVAAIMNVSLTKILTPELKMNLKEAKKEYAFELAKSGCWMALTSISTILLRGLDLTVANVMIGDYEMGLLSIARTVPNSVTGIVSTLAPLFTPVFIAFYAANNTLGLVNDVKKTIKTMGLLMFVPISGLIVFSYDFYALWQKSLTKDELLLVTILSVCTVAQEYFNAVTAPMAQVSVVANKLKLPVIVSFACGVISIILEVCGIKFANMGLYAIVLSTTVVLVTRYVFFNPIYAAYCLDQSKGTFFWELIRKWISIPALLTMMYVVRKLLPIHSWNGFCLDVIICIAIGYAFVVLLYGRTELKMIIDKLGKNKR